MTDRARTAPLGYPADVASRAQLEHRVERLAGGQEAQRRLLDEHLGIDGRGGVLRERLAAISGEVARTREEQQRSAESQGKRFEALVERVKGLEGAQAAQKELAAEKRGEDRVRAIVFGSLGSLAMFALAELARRLF